MKNSPSSPANKLLVLANLALAFYVLSYVIAGCCFALQNDALDKHPKTTQQQQPATGEPPKFDELAVNWKTDKARMIRGLKLAEAFRLSLLKPNADASTSAEKIGDVLEAFRMQSISLKKRPDLSGFKVTSKQFVAQLKGAEEFDASAAFRDFSGRWYGVWDKQPVDHNWHETVFAKNSEDDLGPKFPKLIGHQYAWIGDGFGWNYLIKPRHATGEVVLGFVHHLQPFHTEQIKSDFPLVGFKDEGKRLIWVTGSNVFFEEVGTISTKFFSKESEPVYAITGFDYGWKDGVVIPATQGFQAVYSRDSKNRPEFLRFNLDLKPPSAVSALPAETIPR